MVKLCMSVWTAKKVTHHECASIQINVYNLIIFPKDQLIMERHYLDFSQSIQLYYLIILCMIYIQSCENSMSLKLHQNLPLLDLESQHETI